MIQKNEPIRYTLAELRQIKGYVDNNEYKILRRRSMLYAKETKAEQKISKKGEITQARSQRRKGSALIKSYRNKN